MKNHSLFLVIASAFWAWLICSPVLADPLGTAFTYQGHLTDGGNPANGSHEFEFYLYDVATGGSMLGVQTVEEVAVVDGIFTVQLDFGAAAFNGQRRWLEIWVRKDNDGLPGEILAQRQEITAAPYAMMASKVPANSITGAELASGAVTAGKIATGAVSGANIATGAITSVNISDGAIQSQNLAVGSVGASQLATGAVTAAKLADGTAMQNLLSGGQSPVPGKGVIMSESSIASSLLGAGYTQVGQAELVAESWAEKSTAPNFPPIVDLASTDHTEVWTGTEMIVWGGRNDTQPPKSTGGRYNPDTNTWTVVTQTGAPSARRLHTAVWTGTEMIIWGGRGADGPPVNTGARYNPSTNTWTAITQTGAPTARYDHTAVWTGTEMIVYGGTGSGGPADTLGTGARYNPATNSWTPIQTTNEERTRHGAVWTGTEMLVFGGEDGAISGRRYTPATNTWTTMSESTSGFVTSIVWTGAEVFYITEDGGFVIRYNPLTDTFGLEKHLGTCCGSLPRLDRIAGDRVGRNCQNPLYSGHQHLVRHDKHPRTNSPAGPCRPVDRRPHADLGWTRYRSQRPRLHRRTLQPRHRCLGNHGGTRRQRRPHRQLTSLDRIGTPGLGRH
jgi:hypothetical protein